MVLNAQIINAEESYYAECQTAAATQTKAITLSNFAGFHAGMKVTVNFEQGNTAANPTLKINNETAKYLLIDESPSEHHIGAISVGSVLTFTYTGSNFVLDNSAAYRTTYLTSASNWNSIFDTSAAPTVAASEFDTFSITKHDSIVTLQFRLTSGFDITSGTNIGTLQSGIRPYIPDGGYLVTTLYGSAAPYSQVGTFWVGENGDCWLYYTGAAGTYRASITYVSYP